MRIALYGTNIEDLAPALVKAEREYNVNAFLIRSIILMESGDGTSTIARNKNNLTGFNVFPGSPGTIFASWEECVDSTAKSIARKIDNGNISVRQIMDIWSGYSNPYYAEWINDQAKESINRIQQLKQDISQYLNFNYLD